MGVGHDFNFAGGGILAGMAAWWFVSYAYHNKVDSTHMAWNLVSTVASRRSKYNNSTSYHKMWLQEVLKMGQLDKVPNAGKLTAAQIKEMAQAILNKLA